MVNRWLGNELPIPPEQEAWLQDAQKRLTELGYKGRPPKPLVHDEFGIQTIMVHRDTRALIAVGAQGEKRWVSSWWSFHTYRLFHRHVSLESEGDGTVEAFIRDMTQFPRLLMLMQIMGVSRVDKLSEAVFGGAVLVFADTVKQLAWPSETGLETLKEKRAVCRAVQRAGWRTWQDLVNWASRQPQETCACGATAPAVLFRECVACGQRRCLSCGAGNKVRLADEGVERQGWACFGCMSSGKVSFPTIIE